MDSVSWFSNESDIVAIVTAVCEHRSLGGQGRKQCFAHGASVGAERSFFGLGVKQA